jgi:predicted transcriptional regulator
MDTSASGPTDGTQEAIADDTVLTDVLGPHAKVKMLVAFVDANNRDLSASEVARLAGIDRSTFYDHVEHLLAYDLIEVTRTVGNSKMYRIDRENPVAKDLAQLEWDLLDHVPE